MVNSVTIKSNDNDRQTQRLAGVLGHCHDAFERLDDFLRKIDSDSGNSTGAVEQEIALWFKPEELISWESASAAWVYE